MDVLSPLTCDVMNGAQVTVQWTAANDSSGVGRVHYEVDVTGPADTLDVSCIPDCDMVSGTTTTISNLECNTNYTVKVRAVICDELKGNFSDPKEITIPSASECCMHVEVVSSANNIV